MGFIFTAMPLFQRHRPSPFAPHPTWQAPRQQTPRRLQAALLAVAGGLLAACAQPQPAPTSDAVSSAASSPGAAQSEPGASPAPPSKAPSRAPKPVERLAQSPTPRMSISVHETHPFDPSSFTEGVEFDGDDLLVGTGLESHSRIYRTSLEGVESQSAALPPEQFGEGVTRVGDVIWQATYRHNLAYKRNARTFEVMDTAEYEGQGWGLTHCGDAIYMSHGTPTVTIRNPQTFAVEKTLTVMLDGEALPQVNELECVPRADGGADIYANVFPTSFIVRFDAATGTVDRIIDASELTPADNGDRDRVLNGIAAISGAERFLLTGKRYSSSYVVSFEDAAG